jgi:hypothetical protein
MVKPNLFILGAAKSATTSLADYLRRLNRLCYCPSNKEPNYFVFESNSLDINSIKGPETPENLRHRIHSWSITDLKDYQEMYSGASQKWKIDASVRYLYYGRCAEAIKAYALGSAMPKFVICLRRPSRRATSHYLMMRNKYSLETLSFPDAIDAEADRIASSWDFDWHYSECGRYAQQMQVYLDKFQRDSFHILFYENLIRSPRRELLRLLLFLDIGLTNLSRSVLSTLPVSNYGTGRSEEIFSLAPLRITRKLEELDEEQRYLVKTMYNLEVPW